MRDNPISININFDSLNENLGFPINYKDPSFYKGFDRFLNFSEKYNFKYSIYIIGKDLENEYLRCKVNEWSLMGHEIGNHSYTHKMNIGALNKNEIEFEILKAHELILNATGKEPKGFICPGWSTSNNIINTLIDNNYLYDTSIFPSPLIYPAVIKNALNHLKRKDKLIEIINRKDYLFPLTKPNEPFFSSRNYVRTNFENSKIVVHPLPTLNKFTTSFWHTILFVFNKEKGLKNLEKYLKNYKYYYHLMHPADLLDTKDIDIDKAHSIERMNVGLDDKLAVFESVFERINDSKRKIITMEDLTLNYIENNAKQHI